MDRSQAVAEVYRLFDGYYHAQPPPETSSYFVESLVSGTMTPADVRIHIEAAIASSGPPKQQTQSPHQQQHGGKKGKVEEYVDALYEKYVGGAQRADVATRSAMIRDLTSGAMSLQQAEWAVQLCPQAKQHASAERREKLREYVRELARNYLPGAPPPTDQEESTLVASMLNQTMSLQDVEDSFKVRALESHRVPK